MTDPTSDRAADRQVLIMEAAIRVIARSGVRGLRIEQLATEAGVSTALIYYHFGDRAGLVRRTLDFVADRADAYTGQSTDDPREELEQMLLSELQDTPQVRENSTAWGELRATATFDTDLRESLARSTLSWVEDIAEAVREVQKTSPSSADPVEAAERLTALVEGLSERWLSGSLTLDRARELLRGAIALELGGE